MLTEDEKRNLERKWLTHAAFWNQTPFKPSPPKIGCLYAFAMSDNSVKIGVTQNVDRRKFEVQHAKCQDILQIHCTGFAPFSFMTKLELRCHAAFSDRRLRGEYFDITFEEACAELDSHAQEIADAFNRADQFLLDEIDFYFNEFLPDYQRQVKEYAAEKEDLPEYFVVYLLELSNDTVKIGITDDFQKEIQRLFDEAQLTIRNFCTTPFMSYLDAWHIKCRCTAAFAHYHNVIVGEILDASFEAARLAMFESRVDKLLKIADMMQRSPERDKILIRAANLLLE